MLLINLIALVFEGIIQVPNPYVLLVCRFFQGVFVGNYLAIIPIYINELSPKQIIGSIGGLTNIMIIIGIIFSYGIGLAMKDNANNEAFYRIMVTMPAFFIIVQSLALILNFIPESPNSLIKKNKS